MKEQWKDIIGYEGYYQVSNIGRIRSLDRYLIKSNGVREFKEGKILTVCHNKRVNVYEVHLHINGVRKCRKVHRLVAEAFIHNDDPINKTTVNHIDGDRSNNASCNLEWCSYSENLKHAYDDLNRVVNRAKSKNTHCKSVDYFGNEIEYKSVAEASRRTGISETQIRRLLNEECINITYRFEYI